MLNVKEISRTTIEDTKREKKRKMYEVKWNQRSSIHLCQIPLSQALGSGSC